MKKLTIQGLITCVTLIIITAFRATCYADNPIAQTIFTADPAPMVYSGTLYLYTGHDEAPAPATFKVRYGDKTSEVSIKTGQTLRLNSDLVVLN